MADQPVPAAPVTPVPVGDAKAGLPAAVQADAEVDLGGGLKYKTSELKRQLDLAKGAQKALQEVDGLKKNYSNFFAGLKTDPAGTIRAMMTQGVINQQEAVELATKLYEDRVYAPAKMSKEQLEARENQIRLKQLEAEKAEREATEKRAKEEATAKQAKAYVVGQLQAAFKKHPEIPETADVIRFAAKHKNIAKAAGEPIDYDTAVVRGWNELKDIVKKIAKSHNEDNILEYTGEELAELINKAYLKKLKKSSEPKKDLPSPADVEVKREDRPMSRRDRQRAAIQETIRRVTGGEKGR
jgi:hypothetical protein